MKSTTALNTLLLAGTAAAQQAAYGQCGGIGWSGATTCVSGHHCVKANDYYSQCVPGSDAPTTQKMTTTTMASPPSTPPPATTTKPACTVPTTCGGGGGGGAACPALPTGMGSGSTVLNDPFHFVSGDAVGSKAQWTCRQDEISYLMQKYELGILPGAPEKVTATYSGTTLAITVSNAGKSISFSVSITKPSGSNVPAIINYGTFGASLPIPAGVATIGFNNDDMGLQNDSTSRGKGKFYDLYGSGHSAGAMVAWAWGVSRIIDALEQTKAQTGIDPTKIGVTGCSRNGKGALVAGALDSRIVLTLPQESGAGGDGCWRIENYQNNNGYSVQGAQEIIGENVWFSTNFNPYVNNVNSLPFDHHMLAGLVSPRAMYLMENPDYEWLGTLSTYGCMGAAQKIYKALGQTDKFGYSQVGGHDHCSFPSAQQAELSSFINRFLLGQSVTTGVFRTDQSYPNFKIDDWSPWSVPTLT